MSLSPEKIHKFRRWKLKQRNNGGKGTPKIRFYGLSILQIRRGSLYISMVISLTLGVKWVINGYSYIGTADGTLFSIGPAKEVYEGIHREERTAKLQPFIAEKKTQQEPRLSGVCILLLDLKRQLVNIIGKR